MKIEVKASDLYYKYQKDTAHRDEPKFSGKPDATPPARRETGTSGAGRRFRRNTLSAFRRRTPERGTDDPPR